MRAERGGAAVYMRLMARTTTPCARAACSIGDVAKAAPTIGHQMHSLGGLIGNQMLAKKSPERRYERIALLAIGSARPAQIGSEMAFAYEIDKDRLKKRRGRESTCCLDADRRGKFLI
jgi:hypothetical protein